MKKRILALTMAVLMIVALVGCGSSSREIVYLTLSTEDATAILAAAGITLPDVEETTAAGTEIQWFSWYDDFHNYSEDEIINTGYFTFTEKYGCTIKWIETTYEDYSDDLANLVLSSKSPDFALAGTSNTATFPYSCMKGMYQPVDDYVDYSEPLWEGMADAAEYFALGDQHFAFVTDVTFKSIVPYNRRVIEEYGYDDPAELYWNDEWTWDVFYEMCIDFSDPDDDRYALDGWYYVNSIVEESTGRTIIQKDEDGHFYTNLDDPLIEIAENMIYDLVKNDCVYHEGNDYWAGRNDFVYGSGVKEGLCLFWICDVPTGLKLTVEEMNQIWGDIEEGEIMFAPLPRYEDGDGIYYLNSLPTGYMLITGASNPEGVALLAACERFKTIDPTVVNIDKKQLKETYLWTDEMLEMYDECYNIAVANVVMYYTGDLGTSLDSAYNSFDWGINRNGGSYTWAQLKETYGDRLDYYVEELNAMIDNYLATGELTE
ncbi:MAG: hypothetical protein LUH23_07920 [Oscillospiraceae bacterium]|nr:hypothetical protein [Oscillospiraceae bacterium]